MKSHELKNLELADLLRQGFNSFIKMAVLFGSRARNEVNTKSDFDILLLVFLLQLNDIWFALD